VRLIFVVYAICTVLLVGPCCFSCRILVFGISVKGIKIRLSFVIWHASLRRSSRE
jgi:hypothetical protein